ncbi:hypothetical protein OIU76_017975 [Salix suchowensis]|nr:hypothetical protein OIU76_017975 [Salix suchowensis]KAJ6341989.1 hypothetical protein OIU78_010015 [Salix suchowensis]
MKLKIRAALQVTGSCLDSFTWSQCFGVRSHLHHLKLMAMEKPHCRDGLNNKKEKSESKQRRKRGNARDLDLELAVATNDAAPITTDRVESTKSIGAIDRTIA